MLGDLVGEQRGKATGIRVLEAGAAGPMVEVTIRTGGKILGMEMNNVGSYWSAVQPGGFLEILVARPRTQPSAFLRGRARV